MSQTEGANMDVNIAQTIEGVIRVEERRNEKKILIARMGVLAVMAIMMTMARLVMGEPVHETFSVITPASLFYLVLAFFFWRHFVRRGNPPAVSNILTSLDLAYIVIALVGMSRINKPYTFYGFIVEPPFLILFLLNGLSGLRFDFKASIYCAAASILVVFGLGFGDVYGGYSDTVPSKIFETVFKAALVGGTALVSGYIGHRSKDLIVQVVKEQQEKKFIRSIFGRYATEEVVEDALRRGLKLGGEEREVTILFSDIRNFTGLAERLEPTEVVDLLNDYFSEMVGVISRNAGILNKFVGDGIVAIFGAPESHGNDAERAVKTALEMMERLKEFNRKLAEKGRPELSIGVGINTGRVVVGNIGSTERMEYTAIGDAVNLASRLEELNKDLGTGILISPSTYEQVKAVVQSKKLGQVKIEGKEKDVWVYEVVG
jgi:class 3 adenylate cyclase